MGHTRSTEPKAQWQGGDGFAPEPQSMHLGAPGTTHQTNLASGSEDLDLGGATLVVSHLTSVSQLLFWKLGSTGGRT